MRICLIIPPSPFLLDERVFMTLGILKVAAVLEKNGINVDLLDLSGVLNFEEVVSKYCDNSDTSFFGITSTTPQLPTAVRIAEKIKIKKPLSRLILGGPHITLVNSAYKSEIKAGRKGRAARAFNQLLEKFDILVSGDGEVAIFEALKISPPKLIDADDPKSPLFVRDLETIPFPARHLVDVDSYHYSIDGLRALSLISQLGCPFGCRFCGGRNSPFLRRIRTRSKEDVVKEMVKMFENYGIRGFMMYDDELNVSRGFTELMLAIKRAQLDLGVEFRLRGFIKAELFTDYQAHVMYEAGFRWILVGFESGSARILSNINKRSSRDQNSRCLEIARNNRLKIKALMSIGHPGESKETIAETRDWLLKFKPDDLDVSIITTYPGSPYYDEATQLKEGSGIWTYVCPISNDRLHCIEVDYAKTADYYKGVPGSGYNAFVFTDFLTQNEIVDLRNDLEDTVRERLRIPFYPSSPGINFEHSMGQGPLLPKYVLKSS